MWIFGDIREQFVSLLPLSLSRSDTSLNKYYSGMRTAMTTPRRIKGMNTERGFSLLELLIVVAIILIIATIAIPSLLRSRQAAQEASAVAQLRTVNTAEITYLSSNQGSYGDIPSLITAGLLDGRFATSVSGYTFT